MKAVKGNKQYTIEESQKKAYVDAGFDIYEETGEQIAWGRGRAVPYDDHVKAVHEIEKLQKLSAECYAENETLKKEAEDLRAENAALKAGKVSDLRSDKKPAEKKESI